MSALHNRRTLTLGPPGGSQTSRAAICQVRLLSKTKRVSHPRQTAGAAPQVFFSWKTEIPLVGHSGARSRNLSCPLPYPSSLIDLLGPWPYMTSGNRRSYGLFPRTPSTRGGSCNHCTSGLFHRTTGSGFLAGTTGVHWDSRCPGGCRGATRKSFSGPLAKYGASFS